jgi:hypothetical protein
VDGILGHNLLLSPAFFHNPFFFSQWNSGYQEAFFTNFSFFTMEFWLSGSLFHKLFFFHDGILAIRNPFSRTFSFFTMEFWLSGSLFHELFFFHDGILAIRKPFSRTFLLSRWNSGYQEAFFTNFSFFTMELWKYAIWGRLFIYIYHKEYLHGIRLVKNLAA